MHRQFQHGLYRLLLNAARNYVKTLEKSLNPISKNPQEPLKLSAQKDTFGNTAAALVILFKCCSHIAAAVLTLFKCCNHTGAALVTLFKCCNHTGAAL